jgi:hypothetical protein
LKTGDPDNPMFRLSPAGDCLRYELPFGTKEATICSKHGSPRGGVQQTVTADATGIAIVFLP